MYQNYKKPLGRKDVDTKTKKIGAIVVAVIAVVNGLLPFLADMMRRGHRITPSVAKAGVVVLAVIVVGLVVGLAAGKRRKKHAPWSFVKDSDDMMHLDHYRRTERQRTHYSADPCAYSERHSWRRSQTYDDPWDF